MCATTLAAQTALTQEDIKRAAAMLEQQDISRTASILNPNTTRVLRNDPQVKELIAQWPGAPWEGELVAAVLLVGGSVEDALEQVETEKFRMEQTDMGTPFTMPTPSQTPTQAMEDRFERELRSMHEHYGEAACMANGPSELDQLRMQFERDKAELQRRHQTRMERYHAPLSPIVQDKSGAESRSRFSKFVNYIEDKFS